jgi:hypothetical protein
MSLPIPVATWIQWGQISQFLRSDEQQTRGAFAGGGPDNFYDVLLSIVVGSVAQQYANNANDPNLLITAPYMISLIGKYQIPARKIINNLAQTLPSFTGPASESTTVGTPVTFTITPVAGTVPISYQWYRNGVAIPGATGTTYTLSNPQLSDSGAGFSVIASNVAGLVPSNPATLTVTSAITGFFYYSPSDPGPTLQASSDPFSYQVSFAITHNQPLSITVPSAATPNMYLVIKAPSTESIKTTWTNGTFNSGNIPDAIFQTYLQFGGFTYYYTRVATTMDATQPLILT